MTFQSHEKQPQVWQLFVETLLKFCLCGSYYKYVIPEINTGLSWCHSPPVIQWAAVLGRTTTGIRDGAFCAQQEHIRTRRDRCLVRSVLDLKEERSPRWSGLETCQSVEVKRCLPNHTDYPAVPRYNNHKNHNIITFLKWKSLSLWLKHKSDILMFCLKLYVRVFETKRIFYC